MSEPPQLEGVEHRYVDAGGLQVHLAEAGDPGGDPVLLLHGWPQHWLMWRDVIGPLADAGHRVLAPDLRGFGWSERPGWGYDCDQFASDQVALLDALGIERASLVGHDWGGWTGFLLGFGHPQRVNRMVVCNVPHPWSRFHPDVIPELWRVWYGSAIAMPGIGHRLARWMAGYVISHGNAGTRFDEHERALFLDQFDDPATARACTELYRYYMRLLARSTRKPEERRLEAPTRLLFGVEDKYVSLNLVDRPRDYAGKGDDFKVELVPDSGHFIVNEKPELITERALDHFSAERRELD